MQRDRPLTDTAVLVLFSEDARFLIMTMKEMAVLRDLRGCATVEGRKKKINLIFSVGILGHMR